MAGGGGENEINLIPYMDIMLNLVMFMLVITTQDFQMSEILTPATKQVGAGGGGGGGEAKPKMNIVLKRDMIVVDVTNPEPGVARLPPFASGDRDWGAVAKVVGDYKDKYKIDDVQMPVSSDVEYREVIQGRDALRPHYPSIALAAATGGKAK